MVGLFLKFHRNVLNIFSSCYVYGVMNTNNMRNNNNQQQKKKRNKNNNDGLLNKQLRQILGPQVPGNYAQSASWVKLGFRYSDSFDTTLTTGTIFDQIFRANSLFDPDRTNTGHQPLGFDQYALLYNRYHIYAISWHFTAASAADAYHVAIGVVNGAEAWTSVTDFRTFREGPKVQDLTSAFGSKALVNIGHEDLFKFNGIGLRAYMTDDRFGATVVTNPVEILDFHVMFYNPTANTVLVHWQMDIKFHCVMHDPIIADPSTIRERLDMLDLSRKRTSSSSKSKLISKAK